MTYRDSLPSWAYYRTTTEGSRANPNRWRYIYLRAGFGIEHATGAFRALRAADFERVDILRLEPEHWDWNNGCVLRFQARETPMEIGNAIEAISEHVEQWIVLDGHGNAVDWPSGIVVDRYFRRTRDRADRPRPHCQIFLSFYCNEKRENDVVELITSELVGGECLPILHPDDGRILWFDGIQSARTIAGRLVKHHDKLYKPCRWAVSDHVGITRSSDGRDDAVWDDTDLFDLTLGG